MKSKYNRHVEGGWRMVWGNTMSEKGMAISSPGTLSDKMTSSV